VQIGADPTSALLLGFIILGSVLIASVVMRRSLWVGGVGSSALTSWMQGISGWLSAPLAGLVTLVVLLPAAGVVGLVAVLLFGADNDLDVSGDTTRLLLSIYIALLANFGMWVLALGSGSTFGTTAQADGSGKTQEWSRLGGQITDGEPGLWVAPFLLLAVLVVAALTVVRKSPRASATRALAIWVGSLALFVPLLVRVTSAHLSGEVTGGGETAGGSAYVGPDGLQTTILITLIAAVVAFTVALATGVLAPQSVRGHLSTAAKGLQRPEAGNGGMPAQTGKHSSAAPTISAADVLPNRSTAAQQP